MRVAIVDPPAFTPPYDHALSAALARAGAEVELVTSRFLHGPVPDGDGYRVTEAFYRRTSRRGLDSTARRAFKLAEHVVDMARYRSRGPRVDVVHYQWLSVPGLDRFLLPPVGPRVLTAHNPPPGGAGRALLRRMDAIVAHSEFGAARLREAGVPPDRVEVIPHGPLDYLTRLERERPLPAELAGVEGPVILFFGLLRPYKGLEVLLRAFRDVPGAELWVVGRPMMDLAPLRELAAEAAGVVRFHPQFVTDAEIPAYLRRADLIVLPYLEGETDQSGVLGAALAFGRPVVASAIGGFPEVAERQGAIRLVPPGDADRLADGLIELVGDPKQRDALARRASEAASGPYSWDAIAVRTLDLYRRLLSR